MHNMDLKRIKEMRKKEGWSLLELSRRSGVHSKMLSKMEKGEGNPSYEAVCKVMEAMGFKVYWVVKELEKS